MRLSLFGAAALAFALGTATLAAEGRPPAPDASNVQRDAAQSRAGQSGSANDRVQFNDGLWWFQAADGKWQVFVDNRWMPYEDFVARFNAANSGQFAGGYDDNAYYDSGDYGYSYGYSPYRYGYGYGRGYRPGWNSGLGYGLGYGLGWGNYYGGYPYGRYWSGYGGRGGWDGHHGGWDGHRGGGDGHRGGGSWGGHGGWSGHDGNRGHSGHGGNGGRSGGSGSFGGKGGQGGRGR